MYALGLLLLFVLMHTALVVRVIRRVSRDMIAANRDDARTLSDQVNYLRQTYDRNADHVLYRVEFDPAAVSGITKRRFEISDNWEYHVCPWEYWATDGNRLVYMAVGRYYGEMVFVRDKQTDLINASSQEENA